MKWIGFVVCCLTGTALAAEGVEGDWSIRSYALPPDFFHPGSPGDSSGPMCGFALELESHKGGSEKLLPNALVDSGEKIELEKLKSSIKETSKASREVLGLPVGSLVVVDQSHAMLAARTTEDGHGVVWTMVESFMSSLPRMVSVQVSLMEVPTAELKELLEETTATADHTATLEKLEKAGARVVASAKLETQSGQRVKTMMVSEVSHDTEYAARADGSTEATSHEVEPTGLTVEVDPVVGADGWTLDLILAIHHTVQAGAPRLLPLGMLTGKRVEATVQDFVTEKWTTATTLHSGQSRLLGVTPAEDATMSRLVFLTAACPRVLMAKPDDGRAASWLTKYGDSIELVPPGTVRSNREVPEGMVKKSFRVPRDFLLIGGDDHSDVSNVPVDPFAPASAAPKKWKWKNAKEILMEQGISFPEGSYASFNAAKATLTVVHTPEMVDLVETFFDTMMCCGHVFLQFHLHVVEAASGVVRKLGRESLAVTDHRAAWEALQAEIAADRGRVVGVAAIETKSGQRCTVESGRLYAWANANLKPQVLEAKEEKGALAVPTAELVATVEREPLGLHWEIDPVLGADGHTIDVNTSVRRHSQAPTERFDAPVAREGSLTVDAPAVDFHPLELTTAFTTQNGMWRMIGTWQPVGADGGLDPDVMQAIFVRATVVRVE
jgi:hypothetical protein